MPQPMMNENRKTAIAVIVAGSLLTTGILLSRPSRDDGESLNDPLFAAFSDPLAVAKVELADGADRKLTVERGGDSGWRIARGAEAGYPEVDAARLSKVFNAFVNGVKRIDVASDDRNRHREFGVVDPLSESELNGGTDGVGRHVVLSGADGAKLADLIVGKIEVPAALVAELDAIDAEVTNLAARVADEKIKVRLLEEKGGVLSAAARESTARIRSRIEKLLAVLGDISSPGGELSSLQREVDDLRGRLQRADQSLGAKTVVFVRQPGRDAVYRCEFDRDVLTADFADWAKRDVLQTVEPPPATNAPEAAPAPPDVKLAEVVVDSYGVFDKERVLVADRRTGGLRAVEQIEPKWYYKAAFRREFGKTETSDHWRIVSWEDFDEATEKFGPYALGADEEVNSTALYDLQTVLKDLAIVNAEPKPAKLAEGLKKLDAETISPDPEWLDGETYASLAEKGFIVSGKSALGFFSHKGELSVGFDNGIRYKLRFGDADIAGSATKEDAGESPAGNDAGAKKASDDAGDKADAESPGGDTAAATGVDTASKPNRYLMVSAVFDQDLIAKPEIKPLPPLPDAPPPSNTPPATAPAAVPSATPPAATASPTAAPSAVPSPTAVPAPSATPAPTAVNPGAGTEECEAPAGEPASFELAQATTPGDAAAPEAAALGPALTSPSPTATPATTGATPPQLTPADDPLAVAQQARKTIEEENNRRQAEYDEKVTQGRKKAEELNAKFAGWYYVISDDTYQKLNLETSELVKKKDPPAPGTTGDALGPDSPLNPKIDPKELLRPTP